MLFRSEELPHVVNFDMPHVAEDYVHRIGRTGRAGCTGEALSLVCAEDRPLLGAVERLINRKIEVRPVAGFEAGFGGTRSGEVKADALTHSEPKGKPRGERPPKREERKGRGERAPREDRAPRAATSAAPRTSGNSGGMDFSKPYEPSPTAAPIEQPDEAQVRKRPAQAIPALFRRKAA